MMKLVLQGLVVFAVWLAGSLAVAPSASADVPCPDGTPVSPQGDCRVVEPVDDPDEPERPETTSAPGPYAGCLTTWARDGAATIGLKAKPRRCDFHVDDGQKPISRRSVIPTAGVRWANWGKSTVRGRGRVHVTSVGFKKARIRLSRPKRICGNVVYTRLKLRIDVIGSWGRKVAINGCRS